MNKKKENGVENCVGYAWSPLLHKGRYDNVRNYDLYITNKTLICNYNCILYKYEILYLQSKLSNQIWYYLY